MICITEQLWDEAKNYGQQSLLAHQEAKLKFPRADSRNLRQWRQRESSRQSVSANTG